MVSFLPLFFGAFRENKDSGAGDVFTNTLSSCCVCARARVRVCLALDSKNLSNIAYKVA